MPDFTMCANSRKCHDAVTCRRSEDITKLDRPWGSWADFEPVDGGKCDYYWKFPEVSNA